MSAYIMKLLHCLKTHCNLPLKVPQYAHFARKTLGIQCCSGCQKSIAGVMPTYHLNSLFADTQKGWECIEKINLSQKPPRH